MNRTHLVCTLKKTLKSTYTPCAHLAHTFAHTPHTPRTHPAHKVCASGKNSRTHLISIVCTHLAYPAHTLIVRQICDTLRKIKKTQSINIKHLISYKAYVFFLKTNWSLSD
jgi:hypothetical protein